MAEVATLERKPESCIRCSVKHLGAARIALQEGLAASDVERRREKFQDVLFELNEAEKHVSAEHPDLAQTIRSHRKRLEDFVFEGDISQSPPLTSEEINEIIKVSFLREIRPKAEKPIVPVTAQDVKQVVAQYQKEYESPASEADISYEIGKTSEDDKIILEAIERGRKVGSEALQDAVKKGLIKRTSEGGFVDPPIDKSFNIEETKRNPMALTTSDVGLIVGSEFAAKGVERLTRFADQQLGLTARPVLERLHTWVPPVVGVVLVLAAVMTNALKRRPTAQLAAVAAGAHLLTEGVDIAEEVATGAAAGFVVTGFVPGVLPPTGQVAAPSLF